MGEDSDDDFKPFGQLEFLKQDDFYDGGDSYQRVQTGKKKTRTCRKYIAELYKGKDEMKEDNLEVDQIGKDIEKRTIL